MCGLDFPKLPLLPKFPKHLAIILDATLSHIHHNSAITEVYHAFQEYAHISYYSEAAFKLS